MMDKVHNGAKLQKQPDGVFLLTSPDGAKQFYMDKNGKAIATDEKGESLKTQESPAPDKPVVNAYYSYATGNIKKVHSDSSISMVDPDQMKPKDLAELLKAHNVSFSNFTETFNDGHTQSVDLKKTTPAQLAAMFQEGVLKGDIAFQDATLPSSAKAVEISVQVAPDKSMKR